MKKRHSMGPYIAVLAFLAVWQAAVMAFKTPQWLLPSPIEVFKTVFTRFPDLFPAALVTLYEAVIGLIIAILLSLLLSFMLSLLPRLGRAVYPLLVASQTIPIIVLAPLFLVWFGYGLLPKILAVVLVCFFPIIVNMTAGFNSLEEEDLAFYKQMGGSSNKLFLKVRFPAALPYFFSGLRIAATYSIMGAVIGEWLGAANGIGRLLTVSQRAFDLPMVFACIIMISLMSGLVFLCVWAAERYFLHWQYVNKTQ